MSSALGFAGSVRPVSRRGLYRRGKRVLVGLLAGRRAGPRPALEAVVRRFLRGRSQGYLRRLVADRAMALAVAAALAASMTAGAAPPVNLADVAAGTGAKPGHTH